MNGRGCGAGTLDPSAALAGLFATVRQRSSVSIYTVEKGQNSGRMKNVIDRSPTCALPADRRFLLNDASGLSHWAVRLLLAWLVSGWLGSIAHGQVPSFPAQRPAVRIVDDIPPTFEELRERHSGEQIRILERLNRATDRFLPLLDRWVVAEDWTTPILIFSPFPSQFLQARPIKKLVAVHLPSQAYAAYEYGRLVRWGPVSSGREGHLTPPGLYFLNWKSKGRRSTVNPEWYLEWYFNFHNRRGLSFHTYPLPGLPGSHACLRMLKDDAQWLYGWGESWGLDARGREVETNGTPVLIIGQYEFEAPKPWLTVDYWLRGIELPENVDGLREVGLDVAESK